MKKRNLYSKDGVVSEDVTFKSASTVFTCAAPELEGKTDKVFESTDALITKAEHDIKRQGIKF